jgi:outer membrane protein assembly factor BamD
MRSKRTLLLIVVLILMLSGCQIWWPWGKKVDMARSTPDGLYQQGVEYYRDGKYKNAMDLFQRLQAEYPLSTYALAAELGIADAYFSAEDYVEAELAYTEFVNLHPTNENLPYAMYQVGMSHYKQNLSVDRDQTEAFKALKAFERLSARFPGSRFAIQADKMIRDCKKELGEKEFYIGEFYFKTKKYEAALRRFEKITQDYANVGLDYKVGQYIFETKRLVAEEEAKKKK